LQTKHKTTRNISEDPVKEISLSKGIDSSRQQESVVVKSENKKEQLELFKGKGKQKNLVTDKYLLKKMRKQF